MNAISFPEQTDVEPATHENSSPLPIWTDGDRTISCFEPLEDDLSHIILFKKLWLNTWKSGSVGLSCGKFEGGGLDEIKEYSAAQNIKNLTLEHLMNRVANVMDNRIGKA